jgi:hypothetical protein
LQVLVGAVVGLVVGYLYATLWVHTHPINGA